MVYEILGILKECFFINVGIILVNIISNFLGHCIDLLFVFCWCWLKHQLMLGLGTWQQKHSYLFFCIFITYSNLATAMIPRKGRVSYGVKTETLYNNQCVCYRTSGNCEKKTTWWYVCLRGSWELVPQGWMIWRSIKQNGSSSFIMVDQRNKWT